MRFILFAALLMVALSSMWSGPVLKSMYQALYSVEFGPKYTQFASQNKH